MGILKQFLSLWYVIFSQEKLAQVAHNLKKCTLQDRFNFCKKIKLFHGALEKKNKSFLAFLETSKRVKFDPYSTFDTNFFQ
jgi:hypothetical protein